MARKVLVATDGSEHAMKAVEKALELAENGNAEVTLMAVAYYVKDGFDEMPLNIQDKLESQALAALSKGKSMFEQKGINVSTVMEAGIVPANNIVARATEDKFDEIIMGRSGVSGFMRLLMGRTAARVVQHAPCCVSIVTSPR
jgi:nucleotide-binding universal stress UspA family protein